MLSAHRTAKSLPSARRHPSHTHRLTVSNSATRVRSTMASSWGASSSMAKARGCWRLCHVQTSGCMAAERRTAAQAEHQQVALDHAADGGCDGAGLGGMRLGNDAAKVNRMARSGMGPTSDEQRRRDSAGLSEEQRAAAMARRRKVDKVQWDSAGSHKDENETRRGGVAVGSYGEAEARMAGLISDCRGWGRYTGNIYTGRDDKWLVVVVTYAPDAVHDSRNDKRGDYSQRLGQRAAATAGGTTVRKWKPGAAVPKPQQSRRSIRSACSSVTWRCTFSITLTNLYAITIMGDMNTDIYAESR